MVERKADQKADSMADSRVGWMVVLMVGPTVDR